MGGVEFVEGKLLIDRAPNVHDKLAIEFSTILNELDISHVFVSGYVALLSGRSRSTEDIDVILEEVNEETLDRLVDRLNAAGMWGPAMPLDSIGDVAGGHIWVAREGEMIPRLEVNFVGDRFDRASLENRFPARLEQAEVEIPIGPLELQIAYKLWMTGKRDFEDALYLHEVFRETLSTSELERWVDELGAQDAYERLKSA